MTGAAHVTSAGRQRGGSADVALERGARTRRVLVASHGTDGARAAERAALARLKPGQHLCQLVIVPELWRSMSGDGWRINASTEHEFCDYLEGQIEREVRAEVERLARLAGSHGVVFSARSEHGTLEECLIAETLRVAYDLVVLGSPRPAGQPGLRSRMRLDRLVSRLAVPLMVIPHPSRLAQDGAA